MSRSYLNSIDEFSIFTGVRLSPRLFAAYEVMFTFQYDKTFTRNDIDNALGVSYGAQLITRTIQVLINKKLIERVSKGLYRNLTNVSSVEDKLVSRIGQLISDKPQFSLDYINRSIFTENGVSLIPRALARMQELGSIAMVSQDVFANLEFKGNANLFEVVNT